MIFRRKKYPLPTFPEHIIPGFKRMCVPVPEDQIPALRMELFNYMGKVEEESAGSNNVSLELARKLSQCSSFLLDKYYEYSPKHRGLIVAAIKYFISDSDGVDDFSFATGLHDDVQVMNHVLEEIGVTDKFINPEA